MEASSDMLIGHMPSYNGIEWKEVNTNSHVCVKDRVARAKVSMKWVMKIDNGEEVIVQDKDLAYIKHHIATVLMEKDNQIAKEETIDDESE